MMANQPSITIQSFVISISLDFLEETVRSQLQAPYDFKVNVDSCEFCSTSKGFFMPFFKAYLQPDATTSTLEMVARLSKHFEVIGWANEEGLISVDCIAHEGPPAETTLDILININQLLGPHIKESFNELKLKVVKIQFSLVNMY